MLYNFYWRRGLPAGLTMFDHYLRINPTTNIEFCTQAHEARLAAFDQVVEYLVGDVFVEGAGIAK